MSRGGWSALAWLLPRPTKVSHFAQTPPIRSAGVASLGAGRVEQESGAGDVGNRLLENLEPLAGQ
jgi:hypothetical protein